MLNLKKAYLFVKEERINHLIQCPKEPAGESGGGEQMAQNVCPVWKHVVGELQWGRRTERQNCQHLYLD